MRPVS